MQIDSPSQVTGSSVITDLLSRINDRSRFDEDARIPFFHPVSLSFPGMRGKKFTALIRDVSKTGLGLFHCMPIPQQQITLETHLSDGTQLEVTLDVAWCVEREQGWYTSGGRIVNRRVIESGGRVGRLLSSLWFGNGKKSNEKPNELIQHARVGDIERRAHGRKVFFETAYVTLPSGADEFYVFTREISRTGIGLMHERRIEPQDVIITIPIDDRTVQMPVSITWCLSIGEGWFISGGQFNT